jgi:hypothetical protein
MESPGQSAPPNPYREHPNTAKRIKSVWVAVKNLDEATQAFESLGLPAGRRLKLSRFGAKAREIEAGRGVILLLQSEKHKGAVASFLSERGEAIMGVSIEVAELAIARKTIESNTRQKFVPYRGLYGQTLLVHPELTDGLWIEMFQK